MTDFIDLHCHSTYSLLDGMGTPMNVAQRAVDLGWSAASLTEHGWLGSAPAFYKACRELKIKPIIGCELYVVQDGDLGAKGKEFRDKSYHLTTLALSMEGYQNLVAWTSEAMKQENFYYKPRISIERMIDIAPWPLHHNVILSGCLGSELCTFLAASNGRGAGVGAFYAEALRSVFPNFYIELQNHALPARIGKGFTAYEEMLARESAVRDKLIGVSKLTGIPMVVTNDSHFQTSQQRKAHLAMKASAWRSRDDDHYGHSIEQLSTKFYPDYVYVGSYMRDMEKVADGLPRGALSSIAEIVQETDIRLEPLDSFSYSIPFSGYADPMRRIRNRSRKRLDALCKRHGKDARRRFEHELESMGDFAHYLLLMSDFIIEARRRGILTNTRGSASNSILCYCLKIHDIDSIGYGLVFSRFFNPARKKLPDIDVDIEADRYDDFMEFVKTRIEELEGAGQLVQICNYGTLANRSAFRMAASSLGIPKETQDEIAKLLPQMIDSGMVDEESDVFEALQDQYPELYELTSGMFDSIRQVSQHACGWIMGTQDRTLDAWIPKFYIASSGTHVTQYDLKHLEEFGLVKGDFLRLKTLSVVKRTLAAIGKDTLDLEQIPLDDEETFEMLREGKTEGVFTLQGKENRRGCIEVEVGSVHDVIRSVAIYRPALTREGKNSTYNARRRGTEIADYPHAIAEQVVGDTFGVPVFQEQAMELGYAVGMSDAEVDEIYQAIKLAKGQGRYAKEAFAKIKPTFLARAKEMGIEKRARAELWELLKGFQGYGFNKGHATSYGVLAVRSAYLRAHHPAEFFTSLLDVYPQRAKYLAAAKAEGFEFLPPSVNSGHAGFSLDRETSKIRVGLARVSGLGPVAIREIVDGQPFASYDDFKERTTRRAVNATKLENLAAVGAFSDFGIKAESDDDLQFQLLGLVLKQPRAFRNCRPKHTAAREGGGGWSHRGRESGVEPTETKSSVSKLFWIPDVPKKELLQLKASPWAQAKTWLLLAVDENGLPFHIMVASDKVAMSKLMKFISQKCRGSVLCLDGMIRQPFLTDGPQGFRLFDVTGAYNSDPQVWHYRDERVPAAISELNRQKRRET